MRESLKNCRAMTQSAVHPKSGDCSISVCVVTSYEAIQEPRAPRHAVALAEVIPASRVTLIDCAPRGKAHGDPIILRESSVGRQTIFFPHRRSGGARLLWRRAVRSFRRGMFKLTGRLHPAAVSDRAIGLTRLLIKKNADVYVAHNIDTLLPAVLAAKQVNAVVVFDCMEFYSDMGDMQTNVEKAMIRHLESQYLKECDLVLASSDEVSAALVQAYHIRRPTAVYNVPPLTTVVTRKACSRGPFRLYWRNSVVGLGDRGLEDVLRALPLLSESVELHLQGRLGPDGGRAVRALISHLNLVNRVYFHAPHEPHEAVVAAANYSVGLCLERKVNRNHEFTVSNKIFDYLMAGLPVVASNVAGLRRVIARSGGGILYEPGSVTDLAAKIAYLHSNPTVVDAMSKRGQQFAIAEGNWEHERGKFIAAINDAIQRRLGEKHRRQV